MIAKTAIKNDLRKQIELRAYHIWESEGRPQGRQDEHWRMAEAELLTKPVIRAKAATRPKVKRASKAKKADH